MNKRQAKKMSQLSYRDKYQLRYDSDQLKNYVTKIVDDARDNKISKVQIMNGAVKVPSQIIQKDKIIIEVPMNSNHRLIADCIKKSFVSEDQLQVTISPRKRRRTRIEQALSSSDSITSSIHPTSLKKISIYDANKGGGNGDDGSGTGGRPGKRF